MRKKTILLIISVPVVILLTSLCYNCIRQYRSNAEAYRLYQDGLHIKINKDNVFSPQAELAFYDSLLQLPFDQDKLMAILGFRSITLLKMGQEKQAVGILESVVHSRSQNQDASSRLLSQNLALTWLRLAERNNCVNNYSSGSCIFPIQGKGVYTDPYASQNSIREYEQILSRDSTDLSSRWLLNIAYMTIGLYPDKVPVRWLIPGLDNDTSSVRVKPFRDMAGELQLNGPGNMAGGSITDDFNNDGYLDIITSSWGLEEPMHFFRNNTEGSFTDIAESSGLSQIKGGLNMIQADYNNDGLTDILLLRGAWQGELGKQPNTLLRNNGNCTFTDVTLESGILSFHPTQTAVWADFNNDGWLDIFIGNESMVFAHPHPCELYINNQDGTFTNVAEEAGVNYTHFTKGVVSGDYNKDGWPDIFMSNFDGERILLKNKGLKSKIPQFINVTAEAGLGNDKTSTFPTWFWDYDNDGWPDIFVCGYDYKQSLSSSLAGEALHRPNTNESQMYLYRNNHDGTFTNVAKEAGLQMPVFAMGSNFGDLDNDGWPDMYLGTGNPDFKSLIPNRMFKNINGDRFAEVTSSARVGNLQKGHGVSFADMNNDGAQDIFIKVGGAYPGDAYFNSFFVNPVQNENKWISVLLEGKQTNRSAIGAHISVVFTEDGRKRTVYMDVGSGGSFGANPLRKEIGIGRAAIIDELIIKWPTSGIVQVFRNIAPDQFLKITEGNNKIEKMNINPLTLRANTGKQNMVFCAPMK